MRLQKIGMAKIAFRPKRIRGANEGKKEGHAKAQGEEKARTT